MIVRLTDRELQILRGLADGLTGAQVARRLHLSDSTVRHYCYRLRGKLGAHNTAHAVYLACQFGLLPTGVGDG